MQLLGAFRLAHRPPSPSTPLHYVHELSNTRGERRTTRRYLISCLSRRHVYVHACAAFNFESCCWVLYHVHYPTRALNHLTFNITQFKDFSFGFPSKIKWMLLNLLIVYAQIFVLLENCIKNYHLATIADSIPKDIEQVFFFFSVSDWLQDTCLIVNWQRYMSSVSFLILEKLTENSFCLPTGLIA